MEIINMSKKKYDNLELLELDNSIINTEAKLLLVNLRNEIKVFKNLHRLSGATFGNKLYTLELLDTYREILPNSFVIPDALCSVHGKVMGFSMKYIKGTVLSLLLDNPKVDLEVKIHYFKEIGKILDSLEKIRENTELDSIFINDLHFANFIIEDETHNIRVVDLDSCKIGDNKPFPAKTLSPMALLNNIDNKYEIYAKNSGMYDKNSYRSEFGYIDPNKDSDIYCYIIMILNFLYGENINNVSLQEFYEYMYYLENIGVSHELIEYFIKILAPTSNEIPIDILDSLTYEQVTRAKKKIYKETKGLVR